ncbi:MAG: bifunctional riboflavin kinase/FAD synthetase, partial [Verrucomicrobiae bacterium]|nr:bifunctional riboflavin kinase/FAD synthetase [Verrucomicrobiae bacterium]
MKTLQAIDALREFDSPLHLAIGVFDGIHLGHRAVIEAALSSAGADETDGGMAAVATFDPHPVRVLSPANAPRLLTSTRHKLDLIGRLGIQTALVIPFDHAFAEIEAEDFVRTLATAAVRLKRICVGEDWRFGHRCRGNVSLLREMGRALGFEVTGVPMVAVDGVKASSTRIREAVAAGDLDVAGKLLGRPYTVLGTVVEGRRLGRQIGFPTANLTVHSEQLPPTGVYAVTGRRSGQSFGGVGNLGYRPTVEGGDLRRLLEVHLFDFEGDLYGEDLEIEFRAYLRPERKFDSIDELKARIGEDTVAA